jgi:hypothetical protein
MTLVLAALANCFGMLGADVGSSTLKPPLGGLGAVHSLDPFRPVATGSFPR